MVGARPRFRHRQGLRRAEVVGTDRRAGEAAAHTPTMCVGNAKRLGTGGINAQMHPMSMTMTERRRTTHRERLTCTQQCASPKTSPYGTLGPSIWFRDLFSLLG